MAYQEVTTSDSPNSGREKWNENDSELYTKVEALEDAPAEVLVQSAEPDPGECKIWVNLSSDPVSVNYHDGTDWTPISGSSGGVERQAFALSIANDPTPDIPGSRLYWGERFSVASGLTGLRILGAGVRTTVNGVSYTLKLFDNSLTALASKTFTGNGGDVQVAFDSPVEVSGGLFYEIGFGTADAANMRYADSNLGTNDANISLTDCFAATSADGLSGRNSFLANGFRPNMVLNYDLPA